jgi:hypothetical protein
MRIETYAPDGTLVDVEEIGPEWPPLDSPGVLATLLVVVGALELGDAAAALHTAPEHLIHEATAWTL